jgi:hypothetical protein
MQLILRPLIQNEANDFGSTLSGTGAIAIYNGKLIRFNFKSNFGFGHFFGLGYLLLDGVICDGSLVNQALSANSGQIRSQSSGRRSLRVTSPLVACSIATHRSGLNEEAPDASCDRYEGDMSSFSARSEADPLPAFPR